MGNFFHQINLASGVEIPKGGVFLYGDTHEDKRFAKQFWMLRLPIYRYEPAWQQCSKPTWQRLYIARTRSITGRNDVEWFANWENID